MSERWQEWSPANASHVQGRFTPRHWNGVGFDPQWVEATCTTCKESSARVRCDSGRVREKIVAFSLLHLHKDPLKR